jgi:hypothetical protein
MKIGLRAAALFICLTICCVGLAQTERAHTSEQTAFSAEDEAVRNPVAIPEDIWAILQQDEMVRTFIENAEGTSARLPRSWFSASKVRLAGAQEKDFVIMGEGQLRGANVITFWVFRSTPRGHELVLTAPAHDLLVRKSSHNGLRDIEMLANTASSVHTVDFRFDGKKYAIFREKWEGIK